MAREEHIGELLGQSNPVGNFGLTPGVVKEVFDVAGTEGVRFLFRGVSRTVAGATHPDRTGKAMPEVFERVNGAMTEVDELTDGQLRDYSLAFVKKGGKKRSAAAKISQAELTKPGADAAAETLRQMSSMILDGELISEQLQHPWLFRANVREMGDYRTVQYAPGDTLKVLAIHDYGDKPFPDEEKAVLAAQLTQEPWWSEVAIRPEHTIQAPSTSGNVTIPAEKEVIVDASDPSQPAFVYDKTTGLYLCQLTSPDIVIPAPSIFCVTKSNRLGKVWAEPKLFANISRLGSVTPEEPYETDLVLLGSMADAYQEVIGTFITEQQRRSPTQSYHQLHNKFEPRIMKALQSMQSEQVIRRKMAEYHLNEVQREKIAEYFRPTVLPEPGEQYVHLLVKDKSGDLHIIKSEMLRQPPSSKVLQ